VADDPIPLNYRTPSRQRRFVLHWGSAVLLVLLIVSSVGIWLERRREAKETERWMKSVSVDEHVEYVMPQPAQK
jgi:hypothetical protein